MKYRKKPVVIEAFRWSPKAPAVDAPVWLFDACATRKALPEMDGSCTITTLEGKHRADPGDWIIQGVKGELYPCKPDIFDMTYESAE
jgi:hypothetical protein